MSRLTQDNRLLAISDFSLGKDTFLLTEFKGGEYISDLFEFQINVLSENLDVSPEKIIGKTATVTIQNQQKRKFNGYISSFSFGEIKADNLREYRLTMVPWLWFLSKTNNHRIFQEKNTKDIVSQVFNDLGFSDFQFKADGGKKREYCVQHNESDLNFVSRLLEEDGIAYYFKHEENKHTLFLVDKQNAYEDCAETDLEYSKGTQPETQINRWEHLYEFRKGKWSLNDYSFKEPTKNLIASTQSGSNFANNAKYEHYEYPTLYESSIGSDLVKIRMDAEEVPRDTVDASSDCSSFYAGGKFKLAKHATKSEKGGYIIVGIKHSAHDNSYFSGEEGSSGYSNDFACIPADVHFRPALKHSKPYMRGPQSAMVVGPGGEEVYIDAFGRIKVQFIWDREGGNNENSSCYLRVAQAWAGNQWGSSFIPRIGHEVIVDFLDGDPDRPLVVGSVYNGKNKPVYSSKTQSGIKTRSTKGGAASNCNELRFEDKMGSEQIFIHAEKNMDVEVENDATLTVDNDRTKTIKHDEISLIENDRTKTVKHNEMSVIENNRSKTVKNNETCIVESNREKNVNGHESETIGGNKSIAVGGDHAETIDGDKRVTVSGGHVESISKDMSIRINKNLSETVKGKYSESVTKEYGLKAKSITLQADDQITLKTGSAKIIMKKNGDITISGKKINIKGSGPVAVKGSKITNN